MNIVGQQQQTQQQQRGVIVTTKVGASSPPGFQHICKICKKVYKDINGLMDHQRQQHPNVVGGANVAGQQQRHPPSITQQIQRLQMNRFNKDQQRKPPQPQPAANGSGGPAIIRPQLVQKVETYATLQKPPASLKPKLQSRKQQFQNANGDSILLSDQDEPDDVEPEADWKKWEPEKEVTTISASVAASTAACYSGPSTSNNGNQLIITPGAVKVGVKAPILFKNKLNPQMLSKIQQNVSTNRNPPQQQMSPLKGGVGGRPAVPKLMSKTKAQFQILKSQVTRPKSQQRPVMTAATQQQSIAAAASAALSIATPAASPPVSAQLLGNNRPPQLSPQNTAPPPAPTTGSTGNKGKGGRLPPPTTRVANNNTSSGGNNSTGANRGRGQTKRGGATNRGGRQGTSSASRSEGSDSDDRYGYSTPSPPPAKKFKSSPKTSPSNSPSRKISSVAASVVKGKGPPTTTSRGSAATTQKGKKESPPQKEKEKEKEKSTPVKATKGAPAGSGKKEDGKEEKKIFGKDYKCPPMDKVASYLTKKGNRIWICLVCEEPEHESSKDPMICCDGCEDWYHFYCVGIGKEPPAHEKWFCKRCIYKKLHQKKPESPKRGGRAAPSKSSESGSDRSESESESSTSEEENSSEDEAAKKRRRNKMNKSPPAKKSPNKGKAPASPAARKKASPASPPAKKASPKKAPSSPPKKTTTTTTTQSKGKSKASPSTPPSRKMTRGRPGSSKR